MLVLDGLFLHREPLWGWCDVSVLLGVPPDVAAARFLRRDGVPPRHRYVRGQELYFADADPRRHATLVVGAVTPRRHGGTRPRARVGDPCVSWRRSSP